MRGRAFTLVEMLLTMAVLTIVLGLMVSLARHVRSSSAFQVTGDILHRLDQAMGQYVRLNQNTPPLIPPFIPQSKGADFAALPPEPSLQHAAEVNNEAFVRALKGQGLLAGRLDDLSIAYYDGAHMRDAWGSPIVFMPAMHPAIGMAAVIGVRMSPGCTALTRTLWWASSFAAALVRPTIPALAAL